MNRRGYSTSSPPRPMPRIHGPRMRSRSNVRRAGAYPLSVPAAALRPRSASRAGRPPAANAKAAARLLRIVLPAVRPPGANARREISPSGYAGRAPPPRGGSAIQAAPPVTGAERAARRAAAPVRMKNIETFENFVPASILPFPNSHSRENLTKSQKVVTHPSRGGTGWRQVLFRRHQFPKAAVFAKMQIGGGNRLADAMTKVEGPPLQSRLHEPITVDMTRQ